MLTYVLSRRERFLTLIFGSLLLLVGALGSFAQPRPVTIIVGLLTVGSVLILAGSFGRLLLPRFVAWLLPENLIVPQSGHESEDLTEPDQTVTHVSISSVRYPRIRCGMELEVEGDEAFCTDCFARAGQYHAIGCDLEECPKCRRQMISCGCSIDELRVA